MHDDQRPDRILSREEVAGLLPYSTDHLRRLEAAGTFPRRIRLGTGRIGWSEREIAQWIEDRKLARTARLQGGSANTSKGQ